MKYNPTTERDFLVAGAFNHHKVCELNPNLRSLIDAAFPRVSEQERIVSGVCDRMAKPDFYLSIKDQTRYVSLKSGHSDSMHTGKVKDFILYLRSIGISARTQKALLLYQYGDGTMDGTGQRRYYLKEFFPKIAKEIQYANQELNRRVIIKQCLTRFVFHGHPDNEYGADFLAIGDHSYLIFASRKELTDFVLADHYGRIVMPHIGPMIVQPFLRDPNGKSPKPWKRHIVALHWIHLMTDIQSIHYQKAFGLRQKKIEQHRLVDQLDPNRAEVSISKGDILPIPD